MLLLYEKESNTLLGMITEEQLQFLIAELEEEYAGDQDYYTNQVAVQLLEEQGADRTLLELLRRALRGREDTEIRWERS